MSADAILASWSAITNEWRSIATAWHVLFYGLIGVLVLGVLIDVALIAAAVTLLAGPAAPAWLFARRRSA